MRIQNAFLSPQDIRLLEFFCKHLGDDDPNLAGQLNRVTVTKDSSPYHYILRFHHTESEVPRMGCAPIQAPTLQILHPDGSAPTVFRRVIRQGLLDMFEVYNGDSSELVFEWLFDGKPYLELL